MQVIICMYISTQLLLSVANTYPYVVPSVSNSKQLSTGLCLSAIVELNFGNSYKQPLHTLTTVLRFS